MTWALSGFLHADSEDSDQTRQMPRQIWVFTGRTSQFVGFVMRRLNFENSLALLETIKNTTTYFPNNLFQASSEDSVQDQELIATPAPKNDRIWTIAAAGLGLSSSSHEASDLLFFIWARDTLAWQLQYLNHIMRKPVYAICEQQRLRSACASAVWSAPFLLAAWVVLYLYLLYSKFQASS